MTFSPDVEAEHKGYKDAVGHSQNCHSRMPFVNNEFVSEIGDGENFSYSPLSVGQQLNQLVDRNLSQYGDKKWIVSLFLMLYSF